MRRLAIEESEPSRHIHPGPQAEQVQHSTPRGVIHAGRRLCIAISTASLFRSAGPTTPALCTRNPCLSKGGTRPWKSINPTSDQSSKIAMSTGVRTSYPSSVTTTVFSTPTAPSPGKTTLGSWEKTMPSSNG